MLLLLEVRQCVDVQWIHVRLRDFGCSETFVSERDRSGDLVVGSAAIRELSHPTRKKCAMKALNIVFGSKKTDDESSASSPQHIARSSWETCCLYQRKRSRFYDRRSK